jgi:heme-degrading monooxygenase HmoA
MISRQWRGLAKADCSQAYADHLRKETFPAIRKLPGFLRASILRRTLPEGVEYLIVTEWANLEAVRRFAGDNVERRRSHISRRPTDPACRASPCQLVAPA